GDLEFGARIEIVGQVKAAEGNGKGAGVVDFEPVAPGGWSSHPFVGMKAGRRVAEGNGGIGRARSWAGEEPIGRAVGNAANGKVGGLDAVSNGAEKAAAVGRGVEEIDTAARGSFKAEASVRGGGG